MITPQIRRALAYAQLVTADVVWHGGEDDLADATRRVSARNAEILGPLAPHEMSAVAEIVGFMLDARAWANRASRTRRPLDEVERLAAEQHHTPVLRLIPGGRPNAEDGGASE